MILLLRTAHYNLAALRDVYLHTNTLAALANLAPYMHSLTSLAAQRMVSLFDMLARRRAPALGPLCTSHKLALGAKCYGVAAGPCNAQRCLLRNCAVRLRGAHYDRQQHKSDWEVLENNIDFFWGTIMRL